MVSLKLANPQKCCYPIFRRSGFGHITFFQDEMGDFVVYILCILTRKRELSTLFAGQNQLCMRLSMLFRKKKCVLLVCFPVFLLCFSIYFKHTFSLFFAEKVLRKLILASEGRAKHLFAGQNTQYLYFFAKLVVKICYKNSTVEGAGWEWGGNFMYSWRDQIFKIFC